MIERTINLAIKAGDNYWGWGIVTFFIFDDHIEFIEWMRNVGSRYKTALASWRPDLPGYDHDVIAFVNPDLAESNNERAWRSQSLGHECVHFRTGPHISLDDGRETPIIDLPSRLSTEAMPQERIYIQTGYITSYESTNVYKLGKQVWKAIKEKEDGT